MIANIPAMNAQAGQFQRQRWLRLCLMLLPVAVQLLAEILLVGCLPTSTNKAHDVMIILGI